MEYKTVVTGMLDENCHILYENNECVIADPGDNFEKISQEIENLNLKPLAIFLTHTHFDHIGACAKLSEKFGLPVYVSEKDYKRVSKNPESVYYINGEIKPEMVKFVSDGDLIKLSSMEFKVMETPGHSQGSVCYFADKYMVAGDLLFCEGIGRCDLEGGSTEEMKNTFVNKILKLRDDLVVLTGHGDSTTIGYERDNNPYIKYCFGKI